MKQTILSLFFSIASTLSIVAGGQHAVDVVLMGDSNTWLGGDSCTDSRGWSRWFAEAFRPNTCVSYARSGATWTNTSATTYDITEYSEVITDNNVIYNQINRLATDIQCHGKPVPHVVIIMAGTNDAWFSARRPGMWQPTSFSAFQGTTDSIKASCCTSLEASVSLACQMIKGIAPSSRRVLVTPMQSSRIPQTDISRVADCIDRCGKRHGAMVVRLDKEGCVKTSVESRQHKYTTDGVHTSVAGARRVGLFLSRRIANGLL